MPLFDINSIENKKKKNRLKLHIVNVSFQVFVVPSFSGLVILFSFSFVFFRSFFLFYFQTSYAFQWRFDEVNDSVITHLFFIFYN